MIIKRYMGNQSVFKIIKEVISVNTTIERYCTIAESLEQSLKEMQLIRQGKLPKKTWREYRVEKAKQREKE